MQYANRIQTMTETVLPGQWIGLEANGIKRLLQRKEEINKEQDTRLIQRGHNVLTS
jgi:hypothetical protein